MEIITGYISIIFEYLDVGLYDWAKFRRNASVGTPKLFRWLGLSHQFGHKLLYWILTPMGQVVLCATVQHITNLEQSTEAWRKRME